MSKESQQHRSDQKGGGNASDYKKYRLHQPPNFNGRSGQSDNQDTFRKKGL